MANCPASATKYSLKEVWVVILVGRLIFATGQDNIEFDSLINHETIAWFKDAMPTSLAETTSRAY